MSSQANRKLDPPPDRHAPRAVTELHSLAWYPTRTGTYREPDPIELTCCTLEWAGGDWQHDRACIHRGRPARAS